MSLAVKDEFFDTALPYHTERKAQVFAESKRARKNKKLLTLIDLASVMGIGFYFTQSITKTLIVSLASFYFLHAFHLTKIRKVKNHQTFIKNFTLFLLCTISASYIFAHATTQSPSTLLKVNGVFGAVIFIKHFAMNNMSFYKEHTKKFIYVGNQSEAQALVESTSTNSQEQYAIESIVSPDLNGKLLLSIANESLERNCSNIVLSSKVLDNPELSNLVHDLKGFGFDVEIYMSNLALSEQRTTVKSVGNNSMIYVEDSYGFTQAFITRIFDILVALIVIVPFCLIVLISAILLKWKSKGSIFYKQPRIGKNGLPFNMYKFRTMHSDVERPENEVTDGPIFKNKADQRITKFGKYYRKFSLDELPQIINVFKGEMSLVGPRPALYKEVNGWDERFHKRISVKPGMTGLWQVSGRSDLSFDEMKSLDMHYVENKSLLLDLKILLLTIPVVISGKGAY